MGFEIYLLDLLGTITFAFYGAYIGIQRKFDIFGIFIVAFLTAVGGGTIREILLGHTPQYFYDMSYCIAILCGTFLAIILYPVFSKINRFALAIDALGLVTFALIGASAAHVAGLGSIAIIFLATVSAVGGGLLRDIAIAETPQIFYKDFYASPAIFLGLLYVIFSSYLKNPFVLYGILLAAYALRLGAIYFHINLWGPWRNTNQM